MNGKIKITENTRAKQRLGTKKFFTTTPNLDRRSIHSVLSRCGWFSQMERGSLRYTTFNEKFLLFLRCSY